MLTASQRPGDLFTPIHWTDRQSTGGRTGLLPRSLTDPHSGQPGFKSTPARIEKIEIAWRAFLIVRGEARQAPDCLYATRITVAGGVLYELAGTGDTVALERSLPPGEWIEAADIARGTRRIAVVYDGRMAAALFVTRSGELPSRDWLIAQLQAPDLAPSLLAAREPGSQPDRGPIVCVCFDVGLKTIVSAVTEQGLADVTEIGKTLGAGTNCGSCRPALGRILAEQLPLLEKEQANV